jgi:hypothetical protein
MEGNHYDDFINGCPGGQFAEPNAFALWTVCPCMRSPIWGHIIRIPFYLLVIAFCSPFLMVPLIGLAFSIAFLPLSLPFVLFKRYKDGSYTNDAIIMPGIIGGAVAGALLLLVCSVLWIPVGLVTTLIGFPVHLCMNCDCAATCKFFFDICDEDDGTPPALSIWCLPAVTLISTLGLAGNDD